MLGKSGCAALGFAILVSLVGCPHNVPQDKATGEDGKVKGAKAMTLENGEAKANGIVTYPGGDRVDWKLIELPEKQMGTLDIKLQWTPPRPGLQLAFDVFDEWNTPIVASKKTGKKKSMSRVRTAVVDNAKGKYFIRVYAPNRGDAGKYKLTVEFKESTGPMSVDVTKIEIPDPPKLAALPEVAAACGDEFQPFDPKTSCRDQCPSGAPATWPGCKGKCPDPPDASNEACWDKVCPNPMTKRSKACMKQKEKFPPCDKANPDPDNWKCDQKDPPVVGRVIKNEVQGSDVVITIAVGSDQGVAKGWTGRVLRGDTDSPIDGGDVQVIRVGKRETVGKVKLTVDQISQNPKVKLSPP